MANVLSQHSHFAWQNSGLNASRDRNKIVDRKRSLWECLYDYKTCFGIEETGGKRDVLINIDLNYYVIVFSL